MTVPFAPTHQAPVAGLDTWDQPDATRPPGPRLAASLPVQHVETLGAWTKVVCSNGWQAWVDGRQLEPIGTMPTAAGLGATPLDTSPIKVRGIAVTLPLVGVAMVVGSCFLPWLSPNGVGVSAFKVPAKFLVDVKATPGGLNLGILLVLLAAAAVAMQFKPVTKQVRKSIGWAFVVVASVFVGQTQRLVGDIEAGSVFSMLGLGVYLAAAGGILIARGKGSTT